MEQKWHLPYHSWKQNESLIRSAETAFSFWHRGLTCGGKYTWTWILCLVLSHNCLLFIERKVALFWFIFLAARFFIKLIKSCTSIILQSISLNWNCGSWRLRNKKKTAEGPKHFFLKKFLSLFFSFFTDINLQLNGFKLLRFY